MGTLLFLACQPAAIPLSPKGTGDDTGSSSDSAATTGRTTPTIPRSCKELLAQAPKPPSGAYAIDPDGDGGADAFAVWCDMETDGGGWTRWWWFHADASVNWKKSTDMLGDDLSACDPLADSCFAHIPDPEAGELRASDGTDWATWQFQPGNSTSAKAYDAFVNRATYPYVLDDYTKAWNPLRQSHNSPRLTNPFACDSDADIASDGDCRNFWYADMAGPQGLTIRSFNLDDDGGYGQTAFAGGADNNGQTVGCDFFEQRLTTTNESCRGDLYYR